MKINYTLQSIQFEWDSHKNEKNIAKHGVSFETACEIFFDPFVKLLRSEKFEREVRDGIVGMTSNWNVLYVAHTVRKAQKNERRQYEEQ